MVQVSAFGQSRAGDLTDAHRVQSSPCCPPPDRLKTNNKGPAVSMVSRYCLSSCGPDSPPSPFPPGVLYLLIDITHNYCCVCCLVSGAALLTRARVNPYLQYKYSGILVLGGIHYKRSHAPFVGRISLFCYPGVGCQMNVLYCILPAVLHRGVSERAYVL